MNLINIDPTPDEYSTDEGTPEWLSNEARRIRRQRRRDMLEEVMLGLFAGAVVALLLMVFGVIR